MYTVRIQLSNYTLFDCLLSRVIESWQITLHVNAIALQECTQSDTSLPKWIDVYPPPKLAISYMKSIATGLVAES
jgi:hypothetical protein